MPDELEPDALAELLAFAQLRPDKRPITIHDLNTLFGG